MLDDRMGAGFLLIDGFAAAMHDEYAWESEYLRHGALTFSMAARSKAAEERPWSDYSRLARAVREGDEGFLRRALHAHVPNPVTYLSGGDQNSLDAISGHQIEVKGGGFIEIGNVSAQRVLDALARAREAEMHTEIRL